MNAYGLTQLSTRVPDSVYRVFQACAARAGVPLNVWMRDALCKVAEIDESTLQQTAVNLPPRLTQSRTSVLTFLEKSGGYCTTIDFIQALKLARQTVYNTVQDLAREGLIERGENQAVHVGVGAPCKTYRISELGREVLKASQGRAKSELEALNVRTVESARQLGDPLTVQPKPDESYKAQVHAGLRYIAMSLLGRAIESEKDVAWAKEKHAFLCGVADMDVAKGASTYAAFLDKVAAKIQALGGVDQIVERFNVG